MPTVAVGSQFENAGPVVEAALGGALVLTSNSRAARFLQQQCGLRMQKAGSAGWVSPRILAWDAWLQEAWLQLSWNESAPSAVLLNPAQEHAVWVETIKANEPGSVFTADALADLSQSAWQLLHEYGGTLAMLRAQPAHRVDWLRFKDWAVHFAAHCKRARYISRAELPTTIAARADESGLVLPAIVVLWAFDRLSPAQQKLISALERRVRVHRLAPSASPEAPHSARCLQTISQEDEFRVAARWAATRLQQEPTAHLAILTTKAAEDRGGLYRALSAELAVDSFSFSLGHPLTHFSMVRTALLLLRWRWHALDSPDISALLLAPELARQAWEQRERAAFEIDRFRKRPAADPAMNLEIFIAWLRGQLERRHKASLALLLRQCETALTAVPSGALLLTADDWAERFRKILLAYSLPFVEGADSVEYQIAQRWDALLDEFASLSLAEGKMYAEAAIAWVERLAASAVFQPEAAGSPVEVLGPLEAAGSLFDGIFFTGCTEERWPIGVVASPLLPLDLQKGLGMPGAVRGAGLQDARGMTERILRSALEVFFSSHQRDSDGDVRPSVLLQHDSIVPAEQQWIDALALPPEKITPAVEAVPDVTSVWDAARRSLPSAALQSQAACPFRAFAVHRLQAREEDLPEEGLDASQRGMLLHQLLERVWKDANGLADSTGLQGRIADNTLEAFVREKSELVISDITQDAWQREFLELERNRITGIVCGWLREMEATREPFRVVAVEHEKAFSFDGLLNFRVRADRIDELVHNGEPTGEFVLLDYKSSEKKLAEWMTPRIDEPQLPLYALRAMGSTPVAMAFVTLRGGQEPCLTGLSAREGVLPLGKKSEDPKVYTAFREAWRDGLQQLAAEFAAGDARVAPKRGSKTCEYCGLQPLCRVHEQDRLAENDDEAASD